MLSLGRYILLAPADVETASREVQTQIVTIEFSNLWKGELNLQWNKRRFALPTGDRNLA